MLLPATSHNPNTTVSPLALPRTRTSTLWSAQAKAPLTANKINPRQQHSSNMTQWMHTAANTLFDSFSTTMSDDDEDTSGMEGDSLWATPAEHPSFLFYSADDTSTSTITSPMTPDNRSLWATPTRILSIPSSPQPTTEPLLPSPTTNHLSNHALGHYRYYATPNYSPNYSPAIPNYTYT